MDSDDFAESFENHRNSDSFSSGVARKCVRDHFFCAAEAWHAEHFLGVGL
jgi:hypothetical protein